MCVRVEISLGDAVSRALERDGDGVHVDGSVLEEVQRHSSRAVRFRRCQAGWMRWDEEDGDGTGDGGHCRPYSHRGAEAVLVEEEAEEERAGGSGDVLAGESDAVGEGPVAGGEPLSERQRHGAVHQSTS